ncbi:hypothetical protein BDQ12DRAFT_732683 [Crucibulum laeve]|uniref:DRBM domain-containing protein n=1 Tax=Crucibulum laeve TaxID=68775 RepID=A0A5C3MAZ3_9AGAR|nr:hypothetical protein BDQ12DRAFT_732683 [Crucibulum laeve]
MTFAHIHIGLWSSSTGRHRRFATPAKRGDLASLTLSTSLYSGKCDFTFQIPSRREYTEITSGFNTHSSTLDRQESRCEITTKGLRTLQDLQYPSSAILFTKYRHVRLNNYLQERNQLSLLTWAESSAGPSNEAIWTIQCKIGGEVKGTGVARQKTAAKHAAAKQALEALRGAT